jgi:hypothetical protein
MPPRRPAAVADAAAAAILTNGSQSKKASRIAAVQLSG